METKYVRTGQKASVGIYQCLDCKKLVTIEKEQNCPLCPNCKKNVFFRQTNIKHNQDKN